MQKPISHIIHKSFMVIAWAHTYTMLLQIDHSKNKTTKYKKIHSKLVKYSIKFKNKKKKNDNSNILIL